MKKFFTVVSCAMAAFSFCGAFAACGGIGNYDYEAIDPGTLAAPRAEFVTAVEDAEKNAAYRKEYPTLDKYPETVTLNVAAIQYPLESGVAIGTVPQNQSFNKIALEQLNIKLNYTVVAVNSMYEQNLNLALGTRDRPDMFYTTSAEMFTTLRDTGMLADLTEAYYRLNDNLLSNYQDYMSDLVKACMKEGKLYALPQQSNKYASAQRLYIRKDWLEIAGVEAPTTIDEMIEVGQAFLDHKNEIAAATGIKAGQVIPFSMHKDITYAGSYSAEGMFNAHGASCGAFFLDEEGKLQSSNTSPEAEAAVKTMRTMYERGILDREFLSKSSSTVSSHVSAGFIGMVFGEWWLPKDALSNAVTSEKVVGADWTWVDLPAYGEQESLPVVDTMIISGYNLVTSNCKHPEAAAKLINLFYDIYYNDNAQEIYGDDVLPSNGFYYQLVPVKLWDGMASDTEFKRVNQVFNDLYKGGLNDRTMFSNGIYEELTADEIKNYEGTTGRKVYIVKSSDGKYTVLKRSVVETIEEDAALSAAFNTMRNREKILHFADGYPYFVAYKQGIATKDMTKTERKGWGIYHEMIDENGSYAYVVDLSDGKKKAKYDEFYGTALTAMTDYGGDVTTLTGEYFTKMISGESALSQFAEFRNEYGKIGGDAIVSQVNAWYKAVHAFD